MSRFDAQSMIHPLRRVLMRAPDESVCRANPVEWHYSSPVDLAKANAEHRALVSLLETSGVEGSLLCEPLDSLPDAVFMHDASLVTRAGAIIVRMGKTLRRGEEAMHESAYRKLDIPVLGRIEAPGTVEAGDCVWVDSKTLFVGCGFRTNRNGIAQLERLLSPLGVQVLPFDLPFWDGPQSCLHLMSTLSLLDEDLALAFPRAMPARVFEELRARGVRLLEAPLEEFTRSRKINVNVLALAPRSCVMVDGYPETAELLSSAGCRVATFAGQELCVKMEGGPTCLTRPVLRAVS